MTGRAAVLPVTAALLVAGVLGVQVHQGGGDFVPARSADPCLERDVRAVTTGLEGLSEELVLIGLDGAACRLAVTREALVLQLGQRGTPTRRQVDAVRGGLLDAVNRLDRENRLAKASTLAGEALAESDLPGLAKRVIGAIPDGVIDNRLKTDDVLRRAVDKLDLEQVLNNLEDPTAINAAIDAAVTRAVIDELIDGLNPF